MVQVEILRPLSADNWGIPVSFDDDEAAGIYARSVFVALDGMINTDVVIGVRGGKKDYEVDLSFYCAFRYLFPEAP